MLTPEVKDYIHRSVLCWLATVDANQQPNVSPKEMFTWYDDDRLIIANIASPNSVRNISANAAVCVSFVDVFVQKGFKLLGTAKLIGTEDVTYALRYEKITALFGTAFPISSIIEIQVKSVSRIVAPGYYMKEGTTEESQVQQALETYGVIKAV